MEIDALWLILHSCITDRILYPINSLERQEVILELTASTTFGKQTSKQYILLSNSTFYNLSTDIQFVWVLFMPDRTQIAFSLEDYKKFN